MFDWGPLWRGSKCNGRDVDAKPLPSYEEGLYAGMFGNLKDAETKVEWLVNQGWTQIELEPDELARFFEMRRWCEATAGALGEEWININLRTFIFRRKDVAALFKLTFWPVNEA